MAQNKSLSDGKKTYKSPKPELKFCWAPQVLCPLYLLFSIAVHNLCSLPKNQMILKKIRHLK